MENMDFSHHIPFPPAVNQRTAIFSPDMTGGQSKKDVVGFVVSEKRRQDARPIGISISPKTVVTGRFVMVTVTVSIILLPQSYFQYSDVALSTKTALALVQKTPSLPHVTLNNYSFHFRDWEFLTLTVKTLISL